MIYSDKNLTKVQNAAEAATKQIVLPAISASEDTTAGLSNYETLTTLPEWPLIQYYHTQNNKEA